MPVTDAEFVELFDWLADREGSRVYVEAGTSDPDSDPSERVDTTPLRIRSTLGPIENATNEDYGRKAIMVRLSPDDSGNQIYIDRPWLTRLTIHGNTVKIFFHDAFYVGLVAR
jgi:hypothetical protein